MMGDRRAFLRVLGAGAASVLLPVRYDPGQSLVAEPESDIVIAREMPAQPTVGLAIRRYIDKYGYFRYGAVLTAEQLNVLLDAIVEVACRVEAFEALEARLARG